MKKKHVFDRSCSRPRGFVLIAVTRLSSEYKITYNLLGRHGTWHGNLLVHVILSGMCILINFYSI